MTPNDPEMTNDNQQTNPVITSYPNTSANIWRRILDFVDKECTFYRAHLIAFIFIPLIASGIFYGSNGRYHISYLDTLFLCYSAMTVTGLSTVNLSTLTVWQQVMVYFLMLIVSFWFVKFVSGRLTYLFFWERVT